MTLTPAQRLSLFETYQLTVNGTPPNGLASTGGVLLDGGRSGRPGSNFVTDFGIDALAGTANTAFNRLRYDWAGRGPFGGLQFGPSSSIVAEPAAPLGPIVATSAAQRGVPWHG